MIVMGAKKLSVPSAHQKFDCERLQESEAAEEDHGEQAVCFQGSRDFPARLVQPAEPAGSREVATGIKLEK